MRLFVLGEGPLAEQAMRLARTAGLDAASGSAVPSELDGAVLPATEDEALLETLGEEALFDREAWALCSSRLAADARLRERGVPVPEYFPGGSEPYIVKPDRGSFGRGIWVTDDYCEVGGAVNAGFVTQEELAGDVWSVAVLGEPGAYTVYPPARLSFTDRRERVGAVCESAPEADMLEETARAAAEAVGVRGILEVEAICHHGVWKVIDLNARLPMLTPDALLEAHGVNLLEELMK